MQPSGLETIKIVRERQSETLLAFSTGKDAIAAWVAVRDHFDAVHPYYLYLVPGLEFIDESLDYYERFFGRKITRLPHPAMHRWLNRFTFQAPQNCRVIEQAGLPEFDYTDIQRAMCIQHNLPRETLVADGVRAADSPMRRISIMTHGTISYGQMKFHPVWDWKKADLIDCFRKSGVKLPIDYRIWGRSFDGLDLRFIVPMKKHLPRDYKKLLDWFPLLDLEIFRWEKANG